MDESRPNLPNQTGNPQNSVDFSINEGDGSVARLAHVSIRAGVQLTEAFSELTENWRKYTEMEDGDRIAAILSDVSVEEQLERMMNMEKIDILNVFRFNLRKISSLKEENEELTRRNSGLAEQLHRVEHRVGKAQSHVFDRMHKTVQQIVDDFHKRELDLARKLEDLEAEKVGWTAQNAKLAAKIEQLETKIEDFETKTEKLSEKNRKLERVVEEKETIIEKLTKKFEEQSDEIFELREKLEAANQTAREKSEEAVREALESQNLRILIVKEKDEIWEKARRHENALKEEMDVYRAKLESQMAQMRRKWKEEIETMTKEHRTVQFQKDSRIQALSAELERKTAELGKYERHLGMMEAQIKGDMKRSLASNYKDMLHVISSGPSCHLAPPLLDNPLLDLVRDVEAEKNKENRKKRSGNDRSLPVSAPSSPKRTIGVQASARPEKENLIRRPMPPSFGTSRIRSSSTSRK